MFHVKAVTRVVEVTRWLVVDEHDAAVTAHEFSTEAAATLAATRASECPSCLSNLRTGYGPSHDASSHCRSGKLPHCTCRACF